MVSEKDKTLLFCTLKLKFFEPRFNSAYRPDTTAVLLITAGSEGPLFIIIVITLQR